MEKSILLTGQPEIGKTTVIKRVIGRLDIRDVGGFWTEEIREEGRRLGFAIETISGRKGVLAHIDLTDGPRVSKYRVNVKDVESIIVPELTHARESKSIIIIDEIGTMELCSKRYSEEVRRCLDTRQVFGTIQERRHPFLDEVRSREDVSLFVLTLDNRDKLPSLLLEHIRN